MEENSEGWIEIIGWEKFQHYKKDTKPAWIKLYSNLHTDEQYVQLRASERGFLIDLWIQAARSSNKITSNLKVLRTLLRNRISFKALKTLEKHGFIFLHSRVGLEQLYSNSRETLSRGDKRREEEKESRLDSIEPIDLKVAAPSLQELWNSNRGQLPASLKLTVKRARSWSKRWSEVSEIEYWADVIKKLAASSFCNGSNDRQWKADIDFLLRPDTHIKTKEGKYDDHKRSNYAGSGLQLR